MPKIKRPDQNKDSAEQTTPANTETFTIHWKSVLVGIAFGFILLFLLIAAGARLTEFSLFGLKFDLQSPASTGQAADANSHSITVLPSLVGMSFSVDGWNPHLVDLRNAETIGIPVYPNNALKFFDLYVYAPEDPKSTKLQVEFYAPDDEFIGSTERLPLVSGINRFEKVNVLAYQDPNTANAWQTQPEWAVISAVLIYYDEHNTKLDAQTIRVRLNPKSRAWLTTSPDVTFTSIAYTANGDGENWMDIRQALTNGLGLSPNEKLTITQIWYRAEDSAEGVFLGVEAYLTNSQFNRNTYVNNPNNPLEKGLHMLSNFQAPFEWTLSAEDTLLILTLARSDGFVVDRLEIPVFGTP